MPRDDGWSRDSPLGGLPVAELATRCIVNANYRHQVATFNKVREAGLLADKYNGYRADAEHAIEYRLLPNQAHSIPIVSGTWFKPTSNFIYLSDSWNLLEPESGKPAGSLRWVYLSETPTRGKWMALFSTNTTDLINSPNTVITALDDETRRFIVSDSELAEIGNGHKWVFVTGSPGTLSSKNSHYRPKSERPPQSDWTRRYTIEYQGFRKPSQPVDEDAKQILFLGDSVLFGWGVHDHETLTEQLEKLIAANGVAGKSIQCINLGVPGYNTEQEHLALVENFDRFRPEAVVICQVRNDLEPQMVAPGRPQRTYRNVSLNSWFLERAKKPFNNALRHVYLVTTDLFFSLGLPLDLPIERLWLDSSKYEGNANSGYGWRKKGAKQSAAEAAYQNIRDLCLERQCPLMIVSMPNIDGRHFITQYYRSANQIKRWVADLKTPYLNLMPWIADIPHATLRVSKDDGHPNANCHSIFAEALVNPILGLLEEGWAYNPQSINAKQGSQK